MPNGTYRLTDSVTSHAGNTIYITANGSVSQSITADDKTRLKTATVDFEVTDGTTDITDATTDKSATIVAIYNANGMRLDDMLPGINILRMSNGETVKIIIK